MVNVCYPSPSRACSPSDYCCSGAVVGVTPVPQNVYLPQLTIQSSVSPNYSYLICDTVTNTLLTEVALSQVTFTKLLNDSGTLSGVLTLDKTFTGDPYDLTTPCRRCLYVLRDTYPVWGGILWTRQYDSDSNQLSIGAGDWLSYFDHRYILPLGFPGTPLDPSYVAALTRIFTSTDQNVVARTLVSEAQSQAGGNVLVTPADSLLSGVLIDRTYNGYDLRNIGAALRQLANVLNGPDLRFDVSVDNQGNLVRNLLLGTPRLGQQGSPHVWELGGNLQSYRWPSDGSSMATREFALGNGTGISMPIAVAHDTSRYSLSWPMLEAEKNYSTVSDVGVLQGHATADQIAARAPVVLPELTVRGNIAPQFGTYSPGDDARIIISDLFMAATPIDTTMRIVKLSVSPSADTGEKIVVTMMPLIDEVSY